MGANLVGVGVTAGEVAPPAAIARERRRLTRSYSELHEASATVLSPRTVEEVGACLRLAGREGRRVSMQGGRVSFDRQALSDDLAIDTCALDAIGPIDAARGRLTVQAGARWGDIVNALLPHGLTPFVVPTTSRATAGGTLATNCISRGSPICGKEGDHVESFRLVSADGEMHECSRTRNPDLFHAVIGGFGYLGCVTDITYDVLRLGPRRHVETHFHKLEGAETLLRTLYERFEQPGDWDGLYVTLGRSAAGTRGLLVRSRFTESTSERPFLPHRPRHPLSVLVHVLMRSETVRRLVWRHSHGWMHDGARYVDPIRDYHFAMDAHRRGKRILGRFGLSTPTLQQAFVVPKQAMLAFYGAIDEGLAAHRLTPTLIDILYVRGDDFLMSANRGLPGYVVSMAFDDSSHRNVRATRALLEALSDRCGELGGRVHLVKNVFADPEQLRRMYGPAREAFQALKDRMDPAGILRNGFFDHVFAPR